MHIKMKTKSTHKVKMLKGNLIRKNISNVVKVILLTFILLLFSPYVIFAFNFGGSPLRVEDPPFFAPSVTFDTDNLNPPICTLGAFMTIGIPQAKPQLDLGNINIAPLTNLREIAELIEVIDGTEFGYTIDENGIRQELYNLTVEFGDDGLKATIELPNEPFVLESVLGKDYELDKIEITTTESGNWTLEGSKDGEDVLTIEHFAKAKSKNILGEEFEGISTIVTIYGDKDAEDNSLISKETGFDEEGKPLYRKDEYETPVEVTTEGETATTKLTTFNSDGSRTITHFDQEGNIIAQETIDDTFGAAAGPGRNDATPPLLSPEIADLVTGQSTPATSSSPPANLDLIITNTLIIEGPSGLDFRGASLGNPDNTGGVSRSPFVGKDIELLITTENNPTIRERLGGQNEQPAIILARASPVSIYEDGPEKVNQKPDPDEINIIPPEMKDGITEGESKKEKNQEDDEEPTLLFDEEPMLLSDTAQPPGLEKEKLEGQRIVTEEETPPEASDKEEEPEEAKLIAEYDPEEIEKLIAEELEFLKRLTKREISAKEEFFGVDEKEKLKEEK